jgi:hypothetical protein
MHDDDPFEFLGPPANDWAAWWRGDLLRRSPQCPWCDMPLYPNPGEPPPMPRDEGIAMNMIHCLDGIRTQVEFVKALRGFGNAITDEFAKLLESKGSHGWKLVLKRSGRGVPEKNRDMQFILQHYYDQAVEGGGKRGAIKRVAKRLNMAPVAVRSALRRAGVEHVTHRKRKDGRK